MSEVLFKGQREMGGRRRMCVRLLELLYFRNDICNRITIE